MDQAKLKKVVEQGESSLRRKLIKSEPLFTDTFVCTIGENRCPIKKELKEAETELEIKEREVHAIQEQLDSIERDLGCKLSEINDVDTAKNKKNVADIIEKINASKAVKNLQEVIKNQKRIINEHNDEILKIEAENAAMAKERDEFMNSTLEATLHQKRMLVRYKELDKRCNELTARIEHKEEMDKKIDFEIAKKKEYDQELVKAINKKVEEAKDLDRSNRQLKVQNDIFEKAVQAKLDGNNKNKKGHVLKRIKFTIQSFFKGLRGRKNPKAYKQQ